MLLRERSFSLDDCVLRMAKVPAGNIEPRVPGLAMMVESSLFIQGL